MQKFVAIWKVFKKSSTEGTTNKGQAQPPLLAV